MSIKQNVIKGVITSIVGSLLMLATLFLWFLGLIPLVWEGTVGLVLGCILLLAPRSIEKKLSEAIKAWGGKNNDDEWRGGGGGRHDRYAAPTPPTNEPSIKDEPEQN